MPKFNFCRTSNFAVLCVRHCKILETLTILGRQRDDDGQIYYQSYEFNTVLEVEDVGFMFGKSSGEPS